MDGRQAASPGVISKIRSCLPRRLIRWAVDQSSKSLWPRVSAASSKTLITLALRAVRHAFPNYPVKLVTSDDPVKAVVQGRARLALIGAERFFRDDGENRFAIRETHIEAAAVVGTPYLHILRRRDEGSHVDSLSGRVGVTLQHTVEAKIAMAILEAAGKEPAAFETADGLLDQVGKNQLDVALIFRLPGDAWVAKQIAEHALALKDLPPLRDTLPPFLQPARLPARTYSGQVKAVATIGVQVLIAGPAPHLETGPFAGSPAAALISQGPPLTLKEARAMQESIDAVRSVEPPHPALPSVWLRSIADEGAREGPGMAQAILDTSLNVGAMIFLGWVMALVVRRPRGKV